MRFDVPKSVNMKITVFCNVTVQFGRQIPTFLRNLLSPLSG
jgi:hypothetical protein